MKTTALNTKCFAGTSLVEQPRGSLRHAHTPARHTAGAGNVGAAPTLTYMEAPPAIKRDGQARSISHPRVLHIDADPAAASALAELLAPEAHVVHAATLLEARRLFATDVFSLLVIDPALPDGDARSLLSMLTATPVLIYAAHQPEWRGVEAEYLGKPWTTPRQLWSCIASMLGISSGITAGA